MKTLTRALLGATALTGAAALASAQETTLTIDVTEIKILESVVITGLPSCGHDHSPTRSRSNRDAPDDHQGETA